MRPQQVCGELRGPHLAVVIDKAITTHQGPLLDIHFVGEGQAWAAISLNGTMVGSYKYVSAATFYCPAGSFKAALSGNPH